MPTGFRQWYGTKQVEEGFNGKAFLRGLVETSKAKFVVEQLERGSHLHLQYYVQKDKQSTLSIMKRDICANSHWKPANGSPEQNIAYCTKEDTRVAGPWQFGECKGQGRRSNINKAAAMIDKNKSLHKITIKHKSTFIKYHKKLKTYKTITKNKGPRTFGPKGPEIWIF